MKSKIFNALIAMLPTLILLGLGVATASGQGLVTLLPTNMSYTTAQQQDIQKMAADGYTADYRLVQLGSLEGSLVNGLLSFSIPGMEANPFKGQVELIETDANGGTIWSGSVVGDPGSYFSFGRNAFSATGYLKLQDRFYSFMPMGGGKCILVKHNPSAYGSEVCVHASEPPVSGPPVSEGPCSTDYNECAATIDILLLVTPEARAYLNGFDFWGLSIFSSMVNSSINQAFQNSDIPNKQVRITAVENFALAAGYTVNHDIVEDTKRLVNDQHAQDLRDQHRADIVVMLTNQGYFPGGGQTFGYAYEVDADEDHAYTIVEVPFMIAPRWTLAHEVGHLFGARHNRTANLGNDDEDVCAHARRFEDGGGVVRRTLLALMGAVVNNPFSGDGRILHYSNPDVEFNGAATGTSKDNNAKAIRNRGCGISTYRPSPMLDAHILGDPYFCHHVVPQNGGSYSAHVSSPLPGYPGLPPYTYAWRWSASPDFSTSFPLGGPNSQIIFIQDPPACPRFYLRLTVTSSDNISVTKTKYIDTDACEECYGFEPSATDRGQADAYAQPTSTASLSGAGTSGVSATVRPNPTVGSATVELALETESDVRIVVTSASGAAVQYIELGRLKEGIHPVKLDLESAPPGVYFCRILAGKLPQTLKIVVTE